MNKLSTRNLELLPVGKAFQNLCKSISTLEAIICPDWEFRNFSYNKNWGESEEFCEMRNDQGDHLLILFLSSGIIINGFAHESQMNGWQHELNKRDGSILKRIFQSKKEGSKKLIQNVWDGVLTNLPKEFEEFIYGEPVKSVGTTFCIWQKPIGNKWEIGPVNFPEDKYNDGSSELLAFFDKNPKTYKDWAEEYYAEQFEEFGLDINIIEDIYNNKIITREVVKLINPELEDLTQIESDLEKIGYDYKF